MAKPNLAKIETNVYAVLESFEKCEAGNCDGCTFEYIHRDWPAMCAYYQQHSARYLLKKLAEQMPRVMTLEEVKGMKRLAICAVEQRSKVIKNTFNAEYGGIITLGNENFLDFGLYGDTNRYRRTEAGYGKTWRCWNSRPTDEQREAAPWQ